MKAGELSYGKLADFFNGLDGLIGGPSPNLEGAMEREHCESADSDNIFTAGNYKVHVTCARDL